MSLDHIEVLYTPTVKHWRDWLEDNHADTDAVWLVFHSKASGKESLVWSDAVDVALCFGWIDSKKVKIDKHTSHQYFSKRKAKSTWSRINKEKIEELSAKGLMAKAGLEIIEVAKKNGSWTILDEVEALILPKDLEKALISKGGLEFYEELSKSKKKILLSWLVLARREETRAKRVSEVADLASRGKLPKIAQ